MIENEKSASQIIKLLKSIENWCEWILVLCIGILFAIFLK